MSLSPEHQRLIETARTTMLRGLTVFSDDDAAIYAEGKAALNALALKLARLEQLEERLEEAHAAREEEAT